MGDEAYRSWRGRAIEPVVRGAVWRLLADTPWAHVREVGGWWPRSNRPEIDLVGADRPPASEISFVGTIKWRSRAVAGAEIRSLAVDATSVPGYRADTPLVAVCPGGAADGIELARCWTADDLLAAWAER